MKKEQADLILYWIYRQIDEGRLSVHLRKFPIPRGRKRKKTGEITWAYKIAIDPRDEVIGTFIHECLHKKYPQLKEGEAITMEREVMRLLTIRQLKNLLRKLASIIE